MAAETAVRGEFSDGNLASTYALIHAFLRAQSHHKAAAAVKKAAKDIVVLKDDLEVEDIPLNEIVKWWKARKDEKTHSVSDSESDSDASSDGDSGDSSEISSCSESDMSSTTSVSDSADSSDSPNSAKVSSPKAALIGKKKDNAIKKHKNLGLKKVEKASESGSSESSSSTHSNSTSSASGSIEVSQTTVAAPSVKTPVVSVPVSSPVMARAAKKRRTSDSGNAAATAVATETAESSPVPNHSGKANGKKPRKSNTPFQRIKTEAVEFHDERLKDNAFVAKGGSTNDYGTRANQDLIVTRGDGFRKEKNKKKRGSYRGGEITMQSHSIKFT